MSIRERIGAFFSTPQPEPVSRKAVTEYSWDNLLRRSATTGSNRDISSGKHGLALAATSVVAVMRGLQFWYTAIAGLQWNIKAMEGGKEIVLSSSKDRRPNHRLHAALIDHKQRYYRDLLALTVMSDKLHGETYVELISGEPQIGRLPTRAFLKWLNPTGVQFRHEDGLIIEFTYQPSDGGLSIFEPNEIAYRIHGLHPGDDLRGLGVVQPAISAINIDRNLKRSISAFFRNYALPAALISPAGDLAHLSKPEVEKLELFFSDFAKGAANHHSVAVAPVKSQVDIFEQPPIDKQYSLHEPLIKEIFLSMGVPPTLAGDPSMSRFHDGEPVYANWWGTHGIPYAHDLEQYITAQWIPFLEPGGDAWFEWDLSAFDTINEQDEIASRVLGNDLSIGILTLNEARVARGLESDDSLEDIFMVSGVPTPRHELQALTALPSATPNENEDEDAEAVEGIAVPQEEVFGYHIDAGIVTINEARAQLGLPAIRAQESNALQELQGKLSVMVTATQAGLSKEEAALMVGLDIPEVQDITAEQPTQPLLPAETRSLATWPTLAMAELKRWQKVHKANKTRAFVPEHTLGDIADVVQDAIDKQAGVKAAFDSAFMRLKQPGIKALETAFIGFLAALRTGDHEAAIKSLQSIRLDFEHRFDSVLSEIRRGGLDRGRAGRQLRQILRTFGSAAFRQGLTDAGVLDTPSNDEELLIRDLIRAQSTFVSNLTAVLISGDGITDAQADAKAALWFNGSIMVFYYEGFESGAKNQMMEFGGKSGKESCITCRRLSLPVPQRHRMKDWARKKLRPNVDKSSYECGGHKCEHKLIPVAAKARGKF